MIYRRLIFLISGQGFLYFFCQIFAIFQSVECTEDTTIELWKIIKVIKNLAKNEEKPCPEIYRWVVIKVGTCGSGSVSEASEFGLK